MRLVFATHNEHKLKEVKLLLPQHIHLMSLNDIGLAEEIPETGETLEENAQIKADYVTQEYGYNCFADDTGLLVNALNGTPGVYSARYAGPKNDANQNMDKLLAALEGISDRRAHFKTVIALNLNGNTIHFNGIVHGEITIKKIGDRGFGYDPIFMPNGYNLTFAELPLDIKNKISHRGTAVSQLIAYLNIPKSFP